MKQILIFIFLIILFLTTSCSEDPDLLIKNGEYGKAIILLKQELSKDYKNTLLRNKITKLYFTNAQQNITENDLDEAERNIQRGIIYSDETNPVIKDEYSEILVMLGSKLIENGSREGSVDLKKKYEKGVKLVKKAVQLSENNDKAVTILRSIKEREADSYYQAAMENFELWQSNKNETDNLIESRRLLDLASEITERTEFDMLNTKLLETFLSTNIRTLDFDIRILKIFYNRNKGLTAFNIRFYNNSDRDIVINPVHFILYDINKKPFKFDTKTAKRNNYKNLIKKFKINPDRFVSGMVVFETGKNEVPVFSRISWSDEFGNECSKEFPEINVTEIELL